MRLDVSAFGKIHSFYILSGAPKKGGAPGRRRGKGALARKPTNKNPPPPIKSKKVIVTVVDFFGMKTKPRTEIDNQIVRQPDG